MAGCDKQSMQSGGATVSSGSLRNRILVIRHGEVSSFTLHHQPLLYLVKSRMAKTYHGPPTVESSPLLSLYGLTEKGEMQAREVKIVDVNLFSVWY